MMNFFSRRRRHYHHDDYDSLLRVVGICHERKRMMLLMLTNILLLLPSSSWSLYQTKAPGFWPGKIRASSARPRTTTIELLLSMPRGGGGGDDDGSSTTTRTEEERELDAYIEELLSGVEDETTESSSSSSSSTMNVDTPKPGAGEEEPVVATVAVEQEREEESVVDTVNLEPLPSSSLSWKDETLQTTDHTAIVDDDKSDTGNVENKEMVDLTAHHVTVPLDTLETNQEAKKNDHGNEDDKPEDKALPIPIPVPVIPTARKPKVHVTATARKPKVHATATARKPKVPGSSSSKQPQKSAPKETVPKLAASPKRNSANKKRPKTRVHDKNGSKEEHGHDETVVMASSSSSSIAKPSEQKDPDATPDSAAATNVVGDPVSINTNTEDESAPPVDVHQVGDPAATTNKAHSPLARRPRPPPPSTLYRFLLHRGRIGQTLVLLVILVTEWMQTYLPQFAQLVEWSIHKVVPRRLLVSSSSSSSSSGGRKRPGRDGYYDDDGLDIAQAATERATASRTGTSRKKRRALTKRADAQALQQLQQIQSARAAKYRHVSVSFLQRHGLGPYQRQQQQQSGQEDDSVGEDERHHEDQEQSKFIQRESTKVGGQKSLKDGEEDDEDDDATWVLDALTAETILPVPTAETTTTTAATQKGDSRRPRTSIKPSVGVEVDSSGRGPSIRVGVEFDIGKSNSSTAAALTSRRSPSASSSRRRRSVVASTLLQEQQSSSKRRKSHSVKSADADGGFVKRLRAAAGASDFSRSLLGAYPGDAPSVSRAASRTGLEDWARKYGYGDWSDDDYDVGDYSVNGDSSSGSGRATIKLKKRRKRHSQTPALSARVKEDDDSSGIGDMSSLTSSTLTTRSTMSDTIKSTLARETRRRDPSAPSPHKKRKRKTIVQRNQNQQLPSSSSPSFLGDMNSVTGSRRTETSSSASVPTKSSSIQPSPKRIQDQIRKTLVKAKNERQREKDADDDSS